MLSKEQRTDNMAVVCALAETGNLKLVIAEARNHLEHAWLDSSYLYEHAHCSAMTDSGWDALTRFLNKNWKNLSPYFRHAVPRSCLQSSTASGVNWNAGVPLLVAQAWSSIGLLEETENLKAAIRESIGARTP